MKFIKYITFVLLLFSLAGCVTGIDKVSPDTGSIIQGTEKQKNNKETIKNLDNNKLTLEIQKHIDPRSYDVVTKFDRMIISDNENLIEVWDVRKLKKLYKYQSVKANEKIRKNLLNKETGLVYTVVSAPKKQKIYIWDIVSGKTLKVFDLSLNTSYVSEFILDSLNNKLLLLGKKIQVLNLVSFKIEEEFSNKYELNWDFNDDFYNSISPENRNYLYVEKTRKLFYIQKKGSFNKSTYDYYLINFEDQKISNFGDLFNKKQIYSLLLSDAFGGSIFFTYDNKIEIKRFDKTKRTIINTDYKNIELLGVFKSEFLYYIADEVLHVFNLKEKKVIYTSKKNEAKKKLDFSKLFGTQRRSFLEKNPSYFFDNYSGYVHELRNTNIIEYKLKLGNVYQRNIIITNDSFKNLNFIKKYNKILVLNKYDRLAFLSPTKNQLDQLDMVVSDLILGHFNSHIYVFSNLEPVNNKYMVYANIFDLSKLENRRIKLDIELEEYDSYLKLFYKNEKFYLYSKKYNKGFTLSVFSLDGRLKAKKYIKGWVRGKIYFTKNKVVLIKKYRKGKFEITVRKADSLKKLFTDTVNLNTLDDVVTQLINGKLYFIMINDGSPGFSPKYTLSKQSYSPIDFNLKTRVIKKTTLESLKVNKLGKILGKHNINRSETYSLPSDSEILFKEKNIYGTVITKNNYNNKLKNKINDLMLKEYNLKDGYYYVNSLGGDYSFGIWSKNGKLLAEFNQYKHCKFTVNNEETFLYVENEKNNTIDVIDLKSYKKIGSISNKSNDILSMFILKDLLIVKTFSHYDIYSIISNKKVAELRNIDDEILLVNNEGYFYSNSKNFEKFHFVKNNKEVIPFNSLYDIFFRPDLVKITLEGKDITPYTNGLNLAKVVENPPPRVTITRANNKSVKNYKVTQDTRTIDLEFRVSEIGNGGIGLIRVYQEGKLVKTIGRGIVSREGKNIYEEIQQNELDSLSKRKQKEYLAQLSRRLSKSISNNLDTSELVGQISIPDIENKEGRYKITLPLKAGSNTIEVEAFNKTNTVLSERESITVNAKIKKRIPKVYALVLGVNKFQSPFTIKNLRYSENDAKAIAHTIKNATKYKKEIILFIGKNVTKKNIQQSIAKIKKKAHLEDEIIFYISTHGKATAAGLYLIPYKNDDFKEWLNFKNIFNSIQSIAALEQIFIVDACEAGKAGDIVSLVYDAKASVLAKQSGIHTLMATTKGTSAFESLDPKVKHGLFTNKILKALDNKNTDKNKDGWISVVEVSEKLQEPAKDTEFQFPIIRNIGQDINIKKVR